jgi:ribosomal protein S18 acetylase RimI-like enzyme
MSNARPQPGWEIAMLLEFTPFQCANFSEYASWFTDSELNHRLGPMDQTWLSAVLTEASSDGATWAVFCADELVAVIEIVLDSRNRSIAFITAIAVKPALRQQGIGKTVLQQLLSKNIDRGITEHIAFISIDNVAGQKCFEKVGFTPVGLEPDEHGYIEYRRRCG